MEITPVTVPFNSEINLQGMLFHDQKYEPIACVVVTHGRSGFEGSREKQQIEQYRPLNTYLAQKGCVVLNLVRRGYGDSEGNDAEKLETPTACAEAGAEDIRAGVEFFNANNEYAHLPIVLIGQSQGGWCVLAASQFKLKNVLLAVNLSGFTNYGAFYRVAPRDRVEQSYLDLILSAKEMGQKSLIDTLWLYSTNDHNRCSEIEKMFAAFSSGKDKDSIDLLPDYEGGGHYVCQEPELFVGNILTKLEEKISKLSKQNQT